MRRVWLIATLACACGGVSQSADCSKWVSCYDALPGSIKGAQDANYGPMGKCWSGTATQAETCTTECKNAIASVLTQANPPAVCK